MNTPQSRDSRDVSQMHKRSQYHDYYGRGIYLVTLCTEGRQPLLGTLTGNGPGEAAIEPTALGREVLRCWQQIPAIQRQIAEKKAARTGQPCERDITLLDCQLMPDHFHGIIFVRKEMDVALGEVIRGFMVGCTRAFNGVSPQVCGALDQGAAVPRSADSRAESGRSAPLRPLWEKGYHDRLLLHEGQLQNMIDYVRDNPRRLMLRRQHPDLFVVQRNVHFAYWSFSAIGQVRLLDAPLVAVHVRRYFTDQQRRDYMNGCILAARRGAVLISPFISEYEKRVRDEAFREGLFCIQLCVEPFTDYHKPVGELVDHCSGGHLLLLTLSSGPPHAHRISRDECSALNSLAESMARQSTENIITPPLCK